MLVSHRCGGEADRRGSWDIAAKIMCPLIFADSEPVPAPGMEDEIG
jgi:hypothetical protein